MGSRRQAWTVLLLSFGLAAFILCWFYLVEAPGLADSHPAAYTPRLVRALIVSGFLVLLGTTRGLLPLLLSR